MPSISARYSLFLMVISVSACTDEPLTEPEPRLWIDTLPAEQRASILWSADHEEATLADWDGGGNPDEGGGIFNTGDNEVEAGATSDVAHSGNYAARAVITNAQRAQNGARAVRLMRWTDKNWRDGGDYFPDSTYYSVWMYLPEPCNPNKYAPWDPGDGGWWNVFQFKSEDANEVSQPMFSLGVFHDDASGDMSFYVYGSALEQSFDPQTPMTVPVATWFHLEALYVASTEETGRLTLWQDGREIVDIREVQTVLPGGTEKPVWGIGNYTDHISCGGTEGNATVYFDDAVVSTSRLMP